MNTPQATPIQYLKGIGPKRAKVFSQAGINTVEDLLYYFPRRYEDRTNFVPVSGLKLGEIQTIKAKVLSLGQHDSWRRRSFNITEVAVGDNTGKVSCVWFNQPYLKSYFKPGTEVILYGKVELYGSKLQMSNPEFEIISDEDDVGYSLGRLVPVYSLPEGLTQRSLRRLIKNVLDKYLVRISDALPYDIRQRNNLLNLAKSLLNIHFPESPDLQKEAYTRLSFEEFFLFQLPIILRKLKRKEKKGIAHKIDGELLKGFISRLPFQFTAAQEKVIAEIKADMASNRPMQRLLQGDVGSGKTVVAVAASLMAIQGGYQVAFMVPTEILAWQHFAKLKSEKQLNLKLLTSSLAQKEKEKIYREIKTGKIDLVIGTHALLEENVQFKNLGLVIIDEQHKFGVGQRALLPAKGVNPDILIMTATPIPRTLAITLYGDLDVSIINELPPGRQAIKTVLFEQAKRTEAYQLAKQELKLKRQVYIIYPVIEESYALDISGAKKMYAELKAGEFKDFRLGLIHGRLKQEEQDEVMLKFKSGKIDVLISTTVLEVGIDIANATCMIIEHAERFGLSQLHQLRGRVGRGSAASVCCLISDAQTNEAKARLAALVRHSDGFKIAEEDLRIRGPGEFFGREQHGLSELKIANPLTQMQLLKRAREEAVRLLKFDTRLESRQNILLKEKMLRRFPGYERFIHAG
ncbi:MAG: ATP-dependent DNA helicase RecG [Candidatus Omnitrophica bacterium]|nr:ATP-dependent DNA helicase RecG [Candidatus Omnitrophota bacterium]